MEGGVTKWWKGQKRRPVGLRFLVSVVYFTFRVTAFVLTVPSWLVISHLYW